PGPGPDRPGDRPGTRAVGTGSGRAAGALPSTGPPAVTAGQPVRMSGGGLARLPESAAGAGVGGGNGAGRSDHERRKGATMVGRVALAAANGGGLTGGALLDRAFGDPRRLHPVAGFGRAAGALERRFYAPDRMAGARYTAIAVGAPVALATAATIATRRH